MLTPARAAISRVDAPWKPLAAKTSSAAPRMRALVDPGASRALSSADFATCRGRLERLTHAGAYRAPGAAVNRCGGPSVNDLLPHREAHDLRRVVEVELLHDVLAVRLHRVDAHREDDRDLLVGLALGDELQHLAFAVGEQREVVLDLLPARVAEVALEQHLRDRRAEERAASTDRLDGLQEVQVLRVLEQIAARARLQALAHAHVVGVHGQDEHLGALVALHDLARCLDAVQLGQRDVHHHDVRVHTLRHLDGAAPVARLTHDLDLVVGLEDATQALAYHGVVVDQEHADLTHLSGPPREPGCRLSRAAHALSPR